MRQRYLWLSFLVGALVTAIVLVSAYIVAISFSPAPTSVALPIDQQTEYTGIRTIEPPRPMPDFTLTDHEGAPVNLSDLAGQPTMLTFGFTNCPDICPLTLNEYRLIHQDLGEVAEAMNFVFVSVDGTRDTPQVLQRYFDVHGVAEFMIGMTGPETDVRALGEDYGLQFFYHEPNASGWYNIDHTAGSFLLDADGNWVRRYAYATEPNLIVADLRNFLG